MARNSSVASGYAEKRCKGNTFSLICQQLRAFFFTKSLHYHDFMPRCRASLTPPSSFICFKIRARGARVRKYVQVRGI